jgi:hypothetical protein
VPQTRHSASQVEKTRHLGAQGTPVWKIQGYSQVVSVWMQGKNSRKPTRIRTAPVFLFPPIFCIFLFALRRFGDSYQALADQVASYTSGSRSAATTSKT